MELLACSDSHSSTNPASGGTSSAEKPSPATRCCTDAALDVEEGSTALTFASFRGWLDAWTLPPCVQCQEGGPALGAHTTDGDCVSQDKPILCEAGPSLGRRCYLTLARTIHSPRTKESLVQLDVDERCGAERSSETEATFSYSRGAG